MGGYPPRSSFRMVSVLLSVLLWGLPVWWILRVTAVGAVSIVCVSRFVPVRMSAFGVGDADGRLAKVVSTPTFTAFLTDKGCVLTRASLLQCIGQRVLCLCLHGPCCGCCFLSLRVMLLLDAASQLDLYEPRALRMLSVVYAFVVWGRVLLTCGTLVPTAPAKPDPWRLQRPEPFYGRPEVQDVAVGGTVLLALSSGRSRALL